MQVLSKKSLEHTLYAAQPFTIRHARTVMALILLASDLLALFLAFSIAVGLRLGLFGSIGNISPLLKTVPFLLIIFIVFAWQGLYLKGGINPVLELQLTTEGTSLIFLFVTAITFITQTGLVYSRFIFIVAWLLTIIFIPLLRNILRSILSKQGLWGEVVAVIGNGTNTQQLADEIASNPHIGFKPVVILSDIVNPHPTEKQLSLLSFAQPSDVISYLIRAHIRTIIMVQGEISDSWTQELSNTPKNQISNVIIVPTSADIYTVNIRAHDLGSTVGLEIRNNLQSKWGQWVKRSLDILIVLLFSILAIPLTLLISILIKLDSPGPIFYRQKRVGKQGKQFEMWKFRTMVQNADQILAKVLEQDEETRAEWAENQKLKNDPRITRVGKWL
ncbi:MAG: sugar transferase, partial [Anaerolineales bacterium]